jgi:hypothetical protein
MDELPSCGGQGVTVRGEGGGRDTVPPAANHGDFLARGGVQNNRRFADHHGPEALAVGENFRASTVPVFRAGLSRR